MGLALSLAGAFALAGAPAASAALLGEGTRSSIQAFVPNPLGLPPSGALNIEVCFASAFDECDIFQTGAFLFRESFTPPGGTAERDDTHPVWNDAVSFLTNGAPSIIAIAWCVPNSSTPNCGATPNFGLGASGIETGVSNFFGLAPANDFAGYQLERMEVEISNLVIDPIVDSGFLFDRWQADVTVRFYGVIPEPGTALLLAAGVAALGGRARTRR